MDSTAEGTQPQAARLTLEEQIANIEKNSTGMLWYRDEGLPEVVGQVVEMLRANPTRLDVPTYLATDPTLRGQTSLHWAVRMGDTSIVAEILVGDIVDFNARDDIEGATAFHYACEFGNMDMVKLMVSKHLEPGLKLDVNAVDKKERTALHYACQLGKTDIVKVLIANHLESGSKLDVNAVAENKKTALHYACELGNTDIVKVLIANHLEAGLKLDVNAVDSWKRTALHIACERGNTEIVKFMVDKRTQSGLNLDVNAVDLEGYTALHFVARAVERIENVRELLKCQDIRLSDESRHGETPLQIAHEKGAKDVEKALMEQEIVRRYVEDLYRDRQVYVDAANAILVGAALIASVTFGSWLQPPRGLTPDYADVQHNIALGVFWIFNSFSFYFAIATVVFGARSVLPRNVYFIKQTVEKLRKNLLITAVLLACSVFFVIIAFGIAGCIVLTPILKYRWYMIVPTIIGGLVCLISLGFLSWSMWEDSFGRRRVAHSTRRVWMYGA